MLIGIKGTGITQDFFRYEKIICLIEGSPLTKKVGKDWRRPVSYTHLDVYKRQD